MMFPNQPPISVPPSSLASMTMKTFFLLTAGFAFSALFDLGTPVSAQVDMGLVASTEGAGVEVAVGLRRDWRARFGVASATFDDDLRAGDVDYQADAEFRGASAILDWSPGAGIFHVSFGVVFNDHRIEGTSEILVLAIDEFGQQQVDTVLALLPPGFDAGVLRAEATYDPVAPYVGFGWRSTKTSGVGFALDLGAVYLGEADAKVTVQTDLPIDLVPTGGILLAEFLAEQERAIEEEAKDYQVFPVVRFSVFFRF